jgi:hypothetical protein
MENEQFSLNQYDSCGVCDEVDPISCEAIVYWITRVTQMVVPMIHCKVVKIYVLLADQMYLIVGSTSKLYYWNVDIVKILLMQKVIS